MADQYFTRFAGRIDGPFSLAQLKRMRLQGKISTIHEVSVDQQTWHRPDVLSDLFGGKSTTDDVLKVSSKTQSVEVRPDGILWHYSVEGEQHGPFSTQQLEEWLRDGYLLPDTYLWSKVVPQWTPAREITQFQASIQNAKHFSDFETGLERADRQEGVGVVAHLQRIASRISRRTLFMTVTPILMGLLCIACWGLFLGTAKFQTDIVSGSQDMDGLRDSVGLVVVSVSHQRDGKTLELPLSTGTGFLISAQGDVVTNRHVIEDVATMREQFGPNVKPVIWIFFGRDRRFSATIAYEGTNHDLAILKTDARNQKHFRLSQTSPAKLGETVYAVGFPGLNRNALNNSEATLKLMTKERIQREGGFVDVRDYFLEKDFVFSMTTGATSRIVPASKSGEVWIEHSANINPGNSGGPLINSQGMVLGVNTMGLVSSNSLSSVFLSFTTASVASEIRARTKGTYWQ